MRVRTLLAAEDELVEAARWYENRQTGLGDQFLDEYEAAVRKIIAAPGTFPRMETTRTRREIRRCQLDRFPYYIPYEIVADDLIILAVAHGKRRPNYWIRRK